MARTLTNMFIEYEKRSDLMDTEDQDVLSSSVDMFYFYRETIQQASKLSSGRSFLDLANILDRKLGEYCTKVITAKIPK